MIRFINSLTGTEMLVADERKEEYLRLGHILASTPVIEPAQTEDKPVKKPRVTRKKK